jgi:hypothetical protein
LRSIADTVSHFRFAARCAELRGFAAKNFHAVENDREKFTRFLAILFRSANPLRQERRLFALSDIIRSPNCARLGLIEIATCANEIVGNPDVFRYTL